uniref:Uncharacterized protein n=1 Tax=Panagrolaimus superbus TaxID=310955 RepID=A0A914YXB2_9BILA
MEKSVDPIIFIETVQKLLPEATVSLGWTPSSNYAALNRLDWSKTFRLMSYLSDLRQPVMLTMNLNDVLHSLEQLEWLLGINEPEIFLLVKADATAFVDADFQRLSSISENDKILFDVDDGWRRKLRHLESKIPKKHRRSVEPEKWKNRIFPSSHSMLSTNIISKTGIAFLGWPNALLLSNNEVQNYPSKQIISGKIMFHPKRQLRDITPLRDSGMLLQFFEKNLLTIDSPKIDDSITVLIGYDGRITISNNLRRLDPLYYESSSGKLPKSPCYEFKVTDKGWKIDAEVWTSACHGIKDQSKLLSSATSVSTSEAQIPIYRTFVSLDTPISRNRKLRNIGISKSGDGAIDYLLQELEHSGAAALPNFTLSFICVLFSFYFALIFRA